MLTPLVGIYIRVSTQEQAENGHSIDEQTDRLKKYVDAMGWTLYKSYIDAGLSGSNTNRPALQRLIKDVQNGKLNKVIVYKLDRLSRSQKDTLTIIEDILLANGCDFVSMSENFDTATPFGRAMIGILAVFAQLEREQIQERMKMGKDARAKLGKFHGSLNTPIGYDYIDGKLVTCEIEKMQVIKAFELFTSGMSITQVAKELSKYGETRYGVWAHSTVRRILENKTYVGYIKHKGSWYKGEHEPFISEEMYDSAIALLEKNKLAWKEKNLRAGKVSSYLGGLLYCARCGHKYTKWTVYNKDKDGKRTGTKRTYYGCSYRLGKSQYYPHSCDNTNYRMEDLDNIIFDELRKLTLDPDRIPESKEPEDNSELFKLEIADLDNKINKLLDLYEAGNLPTSIVQERISKLQEKKEAIEEKLAEEKPPVTPPIAEIADAIQSVDDILRLGDFDDIRSLITILIDKIEIDGDNQTIYWNF